MIRLKVLDNAAAAVALGLVLAWNSPTASAGDAGDPVVASVNGYEIHRSDVAEARTRLPGQLRGVPEQALYPLLLNSLIDTHLVAAKAREVGLADDKDVKDQLARVESQILERAYLRQYIKSKVTEDMVKERYDALVAEQKDREEVHARHILVETEDQAKAVITELDGGADFAELARSRSIGPSGPRGGDLGFFKDGEMVPEFSEAAFKLEAGSYGKEPVKTQFGWHVIKVEERRAAQPPAMEEAADDIRSDISRELVSGLIKELRSKAEIDIVKPEGGKSE